MINLLLTKEWLKKHLPLVKRNAGYSTFEYSSQPLPLPFSKEEADSLEWKSMY